MYTDRSATPMARLAVTAAVVASLLFVTFLVVSTSRAAFSDTTSNVSSSAAAGDVVLNDDDLTAALFAASNMAPGDSVSECIEVTYDGTIIPAAPIRLYRSGLNTGTGLDQYLDLTVEEGTGGFYGDCSLFGAASTIYTTNTLQTFAGTHTAWASGVGTGWTPAAQGETRTFRFTITLQDNNLAQGLDAGFGFTWEAQS